MIVSEKALGQWLGQVTTGHGAAVIAGTLGSVLTGSMTWPVAIPALVAGLVLTIWPEQRAMAQQASDAVKAAEIVTQAAIALETAKPASQGGAA